MNENAASPQQDLSFDDVVVVQAKSDQNNNSSAPRLVRQPPLTLLKNPEYKFGGEINRQQPDKAMQAPDEHFQAAYGDFIIKQCLEKGYFRQIRIYIDRQEM
jgi:hypothetical protein